MNRLLWIPVVMVVASAATYFLVGRPHAVQLQQPGFSLEVPAGWHVDTAEDDYNPENRFTVVAPSETPTHVLFYLYDHAVDAHERADFMAEYMAQKNPDALRASFVQWGNYQGEGREVREAASSKIPSVRRIFVHTGRARSFMVVETYLVAYEEGLRPSLQRLASSFHFVDPATHD